VPVTVDQISHSETTGSSLSITIACFFPASGHGIQGGTSRCLGQNFSKIFDISVESPSGATEKLFAWQNNWAFSTRAIGSMVMTHSDDEGLVMPPKVSQLQVVLIATGSDTDTPNEDKSNLSEIIRMAENSLKKVNIGVKAEVADSSLVTESLDLYRLKVLPFHYALTSGHTARGGDGPSGDS
jgi:prolyl-tRNA synthetase